MVSSLSFPTVVSSSSLALDVPPPTQDISRTAMPHVFVIPPEEEHDENPPFCYFDATEAARDAQYSTKLDIEALETALNFHQQVDNRAPAFRRSNDSQETVVLPRRSSLTQIREDVAEDCRDRRKKVMDEDVVEVVKVRRNDAGDMQDQGMKKSKTFRLRATEALKSIKNVGRTSRKLSASGSGSSCGSQENVRPVRSSEYAEREIAPRHSIQKLPRRKSLTLSHVFTFSQNHRPTPGEPGSEGVSLAPHPSGQDEDVRHRREEQQEQEYPPRPDTPTIPRRKSLTLSQFFTFSPNHRPTSPDSDADTRDTFAQSRPLSKHYSMATLATFTSPSKQRLHPSPSIEDYGSVRSTSPTGPEPLTRLSKRRSFRKRISVLDLQKLFSAQGSSTSAESQEQKSPQAGVSDVFSEAGSPELAASTSTGSSSYSIISSVSFSDEEMRRQSEDAGAADVGGELDIEMRLDSLHFDSLHFDLDEF